MTPRRFFTYLLGFLLVLTIVASFIGCATFPVSKETIKVTITVLDRETNTPLQGATVACNGRVMIANEKGHTFFNDVPVGLVKLYTRKTGYWDAGITTYREKDLINTVYLRKVK